MTSRRCKDCPPESKRPVVAGPGPRCATHARAWRKRSRDLAHARHIESDFGITADEYWEIHAYQGGRCAICGHATGKCKRLAVDHDHELAKTHDHPDNVGCRLCIRGLLCGRCNRWGVPLFLAAVLRAINYLTDPPARKVLNASSTRSV